MNLFNSLIRGRLAPILAATFGLLQVLIIGFRGADESVIQWWRRARELGQTWRSNPGDILAHPPTHDSFIDAYGASFFTLAPDLAPWLLVVVIAFAGALSTGLAFALGRRLSRAITGWLCVAMLLCCAPWLGAFTAADPTALLLPLWLGGLLLWHHKRLPWWSRALFTSPVFALAILVWAPSILLVAVLLLRSILSQNASLKAFALHRLVPAVLGVLCLLAYPFFWPDPLSSIQAFLFLPLEMDPTVLLFRDATYPPGGLPLYFGLVFLIEQLPLALATAVCCGLVWTLWKLRHRKATPLQTDLFLLSIALLLLPTLVGTPFPQGMGLALLTLAMMAPLGAEATRCFFVFTLSRSAPSKNARQIALTTYLLLMSSILMEVPRAITAPEAFRSPMTARLTGWSAAGDMPTRSPLLPIELIKFASPNPNSTLYVEPWEDTLQTYQQMSLLGDLQITDTPAEADFMIRPIPSIHSDAHSTYPAHAVPPLPSSTTEVFPVVHRPLFLIDTSLNGN